jgi:N-succinyl-L-ornithine transcarbamylase
LEKSKQIAESQGGSLKQTNNQLESLSNAQVVVAKSWSGWQGYDNRETESQIRKQYQNWMIDPQKMALTNNAGFMHCLPVRRNVVVHDDVIDGSNSWTKETAGLRMWTAMALLEAMLREI